METLAAKICIIEAMSKRKGLSHKEGGLESAREMVLFKDAGLATPMGTLHKLMPWLDNSFNFVIDSRQSGVSHVVVPH